MTVVFMLIKQICEFKAHGNLPWHEFRLGSIWKDFTKDELSEISLNGTAHDFSVDRIAIEKEELF